MDFLQIKRILFGIQGVQQNSPARGHLFQCERNSMNQCVPIPKLNAAAQIGESSSAVVFQIYLLSSPKVILGAPNREWICLLRQNGTVRRKLDCLAKTVIAIPTKCGHTGSQRESSTKKRPISLKKRSCLGVTKKKRRNQEQKEKKLF